MPLDFIPNFAVGPILGLAANGVVGVLSLVVLIIYRHYRPLRSLFLFHLSLTFCFLGWVIFGLQESPQSIVLGYRIDYSGLSLLPACWVWFVSALFDEKPSRLVWAVTVISLVLAALALLGEGPYFFTLPLESDPVTPSILRPRSELLRPVIQGFCLTVCLFSFLLIIRRLSRLKGRRAAYLVCVSIGLLIWFLGGVHDALRSTGMTVLMKGQILWFASLWLSIFLTGAIALHFRSLERVARKELERLNRAKSNALDHLSHELKTPLSVIQGNLRLLKRKLEAVPGEREKSFEILERQLHRLLDIQQETDRIIRSYKELEEEPTSLFPFARKTLERVKQRASNRNIHFYFEEQKDLSVFLNPEILDDLLECLLKNAIENTPDEGMIRIFTEQSNGKVHLKVQDLGIGITEENQKIVFDGLVHMQDTDLYASKEPYDFYAGGKGLDLLRMKAYGKRFRFELSMESKRCIYLPTNRDLCPGKISACSHCKGPEDCFSSGGSTFCVTFPVGGSRKHEKRKLPF